MLYEVITYKLSIYDKLYWIQAIYNVEHKGDYMNYGFLRVGVAVPELKVAGCSYNIDKIKELAKKAEESKVKILVFPELSVTGYTCADLFQHVITSYSIHYTKLYDVSSTQAYF